ncbi:MAG: NUDIX domain-containing protein, partial [Thermoplasmata archaeon]
SSIMYSVKVKLSLMRDGNFVLSEGRARLLKLVNEEGSITIAAKKMKMSYRHAWGVLRAISDSAGAKIVSTQRGGKEGGKTILTPEGKRLLEEYESKKNHIEKMIKDGNVYRQPALTVDGIVTIDGKVVLVRRAREPFKGRYALPGGFVEYGERTEDAVVREVKEETGLDTKVTRLLTVRSDPLRDPRGHTVSVIYVLEKVSGKLSGGDDAERAELFSLKSLPELAFDHAEILDIYKNELKID